MAMTRSLETLDLSRALVPLAGQERIVRDGFWAKVRKTLGKVPFLEDAIAAYYAAIDPATPAKARAVMLAALAYFVVPGDFIPDILAVVGFSDDLAVFLLLARTLGAHVKPAHRERARAFLDAQSSPRP